jgi:gamma-glutamyltranspeptidase
MKLVQARAENLCPDIHARVANVQPESVCLSACLFVFIGALAAGVPGEVKGMYTAWRKFGKLPWKDLIQPAIDLATNGYKISKPLHTAMLSKEQYIKDDPGLR